MKQLQFNTLSTGEMALTLWAINNGSYEGVPVSKALAFEAEFLANVKTQLPNVIKDMDASGKMSDADEEALTKAMQSFRASTGYVQA